MDFLRNQLSPIQEQLTKVNAEIDELKLKIKLSNAADASDKGDEIVHDGTLLSKIDLTQEDISFDISFDLVITVDNCSYRSNLNMTMPCGNLIEEGTSSIEKTDMSDLIFRRE